MGSKSRPERLEFTLMNEKVHGDSPVGPLRETFHDRWLLAVKLLNPSKPAAFTAASSPKVDAA